MRLTYIRGLILFSNCAGPFELQNLYTFFSLTIVLLNPYLSYFENNVDLDPHELTSDEAIRSGITLFHSNLGENLKISMLSDNELM